MTLSPEDQQQLALAAKILEHPAFMSSLTRKMGRTVEKVIGILPDQLSGSITNITRTALEKSLEGALFTLKPKKTSGKYPKTHQWLAGLSGAVGGSFGLAALAVELPLSTTIMFRSIAEIARNNGEDIQSPATKMACLEVFALSDATNKPSSETGYYAIRSLLAKSLSDAASQISVQGLNLQGSPALVNAINKIAARFSIPVSEKLAAQSVPIIGAIGGATVNLLFIRYFQEIADAHFTIRRLERKYSPKTIKKMYQKIIAKQLS